jgi:predicted amidohydrolase YtcJ
MAATPSRTLVASIYYNGNIETMDSAGDVAQAVAIDFHGKLAGVGSNDEILSNFYSLITVDLHGKTVLPGFIDTHSHLQGWGGLADREWIDLGSTNVLLKPLPSDRFRCFHPTDPQECFIPVTTQEEVISRLQQAVDHAQPGDWILATEYDPARLGHGPTCPGDASKVGFECLNFEDGNAREYLDAISTTHPILVGSQSGHIAYANSAMLKILNICGTGFVEPTRCVKPTLPLFYPEEEEKMANLGQLNEDLSGLAQGKAIEHILAKDPGYALRTFAHALATYAANGYTLTQEGVASDAQVQAYLLFNALLPLPVTVAVLYNDGSPDFAGAVEKANNYRDEAQKAKRPNVIIQGMKDFADGSNQGYTGFLTQGYLNLYKPFTDMGIFPAQYFGDPYLGIPDSNQDLITDHANLAHASNFPLAIHQNGDGAIAYTLGGLQAASRPSGVRDMMIHFSLASRADLDVAKSMDAGVTFLITNLYYYGLPLCQQVLGPERTIPIYPTGDALRAGLRFSLHPDSPVGAPNPLFMIWVAKTRAAQQPAWYPNLDPQSCPAFMDPEHQGISIRQGVKALTIDAAYVYGLEAQYGSVEVGKFADLVLLTADPLAMENNPDGLRDIRVLGTVHHGDFYPNLGSIFPQIWPN